MQTISTHAQDVTIRTMARNAVSPAQAHLCSCSLVANGNSLGPGFCLNNVGGAIDPNGSTLNGFHSLLSLDQIYCVSGSGVCTSNADCGPWPGTTCAIFDISADTCAGGICVLPCS